MPGNVDEQISNTFVIDGETLRDLDALIRRYRDDIDGTAEVGYFVHRVDGFEYATDEIEDVLRERNGAQTRIDSIRAEIRGSNVIRFRIYFAEEIDIRGGCEDRAKLLALVTDVRALVRDRIIKGRRWKRNTVIGWAAVACFLIGYFGFQIFQNTYTGQVEARRQQAYVERSEPYTKQLAAANPSSQVLGEQVDQAKKALAQGDLRAEVSFLVQQQIEQLRQQIIEQQEQAVAKYPYGIVAPWWASNWWAAVAVGVIASLFAAGIVYFLLPALGTTFMIGDEIVRQRRRSGRREKIIWGVGVAFIVGIASGIIASLVP